MTAYPCCQSSSSANIQIFIRPSRRMRSQNWRCQNLHLATPWWLFDGHLELDPIYLDTLSFHSSFLWWLKKTYRDAVAARHFLRLILELLPDIAQDHVNLRSHHTPSENHLGPGNHSEFTVASWRAGACYRCMMPGVMKTTAAKRQTYHDHPIQSAVHCAVSQQTSKKTNAVKRNIGTHGMRNLLGELNSEHSGNESALLGNGSQVLVSLS